MPTLQLIQSGGYPPAMNLEMTILAGTTVPSGIEVTDSGAVFTWETLAPVVSTLQPTRTLVDLLVNLDAGTTLPIGTQVEHSGTAELFELTAEVTNGGGATRDFIVSAQSVNLGPIQADPGTLTVIPAPVAGWNSVTNLLAPSQIGNLNDVIDVPCAQTGGPTDEVSLAESITVVITVNPDIVSVRNRTDSIPGLVDATGVVDIQDGDLVLADRREGIRTLLQGNLALRRGEWFLDPTAGIPYQQRFLVKNPSIPEIRSVIRKACLATPGIESVLSIETDFDRAKRTLAVSGSVTLVDDDVPLEFSVPLTSEVLDV